MKSWYIKANKFSLFFRSFMPFYTYNANYWGDKVATFWRLVEIKIKVLVARFDGSLLRIEGAFVLAFSTKHQDECQESNQKV